MIRLPLYASYAGRSFIPQRQGSEDVQNMCNPAESVRPAYSPLGLGHPEARQKAARSEGAEVCRLCTTDASLTSPSGDDGGVCVSGWGGGGKRTIRVQQRIPPLRCSRRVFASPSLQWPGDGSNSSSDRATPPFKRWTHSPMCQSFGPTPMGPQQIRSKMIAFPAPLPGRR